MSEQEYFEAIKFQIQLFVVYWRILTVQMIYLSYLKKKNYVVGVIESASPIKRAFSSLVYAYFNS